MVRGLLRAKNLYQLVAASQVYFTYVSGGGVISSIQAPQNHFSPFSTRLLATSAAATITQAGDAAIVPVMASVVKRPASCVMC